MNREQLIGLIAADSKFLDERDTITEYVRGLTVGEGLDEAAIRAGYQRFKDEKHAAELAAAAEQHGLAPETLQAFVDNILSRMIFDGEQLTELLSPLDLGWRARTGMELALMADLVPLLKKRRRRPRHLRTQGVRGIGDGQGRQTITDVEAEVSGVHWAHGARSATKGRYGRKYDPKRKNASYNVGDGSNEV
jgi:hypothetical protein